MASELTRVGITKLAAATGMEEVELAFLADRTPAELRELREMADRARFARHEERVKVLAALSRRLPPQLGAKIAQSALGPVLSGRIAGALDPDSAAALAAHVEPGFLVSLAASVDPTRVAAIIGRLPTEVVVDIGRRLLAAHDYLTLGRFVGLVDHEVSLAVVEGASGEEILEVMLYADEPAALRPMVERLPAPLVTEIVARAREAGVGDDLAVELS